MSQRIDRVDELLRQEISTILGREVSDPRIGFVTVTKVETSPDLAHARVWISVIGQPAERSATLSALRRAMPFVRRGLGGRIRIRRIPELHVEVDETAERGTRVLQLLHELEEGRAPAELPPTAESLPSPAPRSGGPLDAAEPADASSSSDKGVESRAARVSRQGPSSRPGSRSRRDPGDPAARGARGGRRSGRR